MLLCFSPSSSMVKRQLPLDVVRLELVACPKTQDDQPMHSKVSREQLQVYVFVFALLIGCERPRTGLDKCGGCCCKKLPVTSLSLVASRTWSLGAWDCKLTSMLTLTGSSTSMIQPMIMIIIA